MGDVGHPELAEAELVLVDIAATEALSVLCRRAKQRRTSPPDLAAAIAKVQVGPSAERFGA